MTPWSYFYDQILPEIPGMSAGTALDQYIRNVAINFCEDTLADQVTLTPITLVAGTPTYTLPVPSTDYDIAEPMYVWVGTNKVKPTTMDILNATSDYWPNDTGTPRAYFQQTQDTITLYPNPDAACVALAPPLTILAAVRPANTTTQMTDWIANKYQRDIANGVKAMLMAMPAKPWSNPDLSQYYQKWYDEGLSNAIADIKRSFTRTGMKVRFRKL